MMGLDQQIEHVARAFYGVDNDEQTWDRAPDDLKEEFRRFANDAIAMVTICRESSINPSSTTCAGPHEMVPA
ncbi:hypothetical protein AA309_10180 [Microvirga vignae]|uniref:Uncharacterized protein n=1 Tax=Microvirga vignae TaxID=1225564 RepID=A0A0H1RE40_9HYPH|nr:hypothetical protein [Microvirga vignae]KLK93156.1 hypothetical protein AA309_10180 [Microvirga vignae]